MTPFAVLRVSISSNGIEYDLQLPGHETSEPIRYVPMQPVRNADLTALQVLCAKLLRSPVSASFPREAKLTGEKLYASLVPRELGAALGALQCPLLVSTPRSGLPCELFYADEFWGLRYAIGKQIRMDLPGRRPEAVPLSRRLRALIICSDPRGDLAFVDDEAERVFECLRRAGADVRVLGSAEASVDQVRRRLAEGYNLIHYCGHVVRFGANASDPPGLLLAGEQVLSGDEIKNAIYGWPVVFLNGCASARNGMATCSYSWEEDISSVAYAFIRGGARAVVATASEIADEHAADVAVEFFGQALSGATLGEALRLARVHTRSVAPYSPTWMSFVLYGNPADLLVERGRTLNPPSLPTRRRPSRRDALLLLGGATLLLSASVVLWEYAKHWPYHGFRYLQSFDDAASVEDFWTIDDVPWSTNVEDGQYCLANRDTNYTNAVHYFHVGFEHTDVSDAPVSARIRTEGMNEKSRAGLLYRFNPTTKDYYALVVSANGNWEFLKRIKGLYLENALAKGRTASSELGRFVELAIVGTGPRIDIYVDGRRATSIQDHQLTTGFPGIIAMSTGVHCFDYFGIHKR